jgi:manganese peroxidase
MMHMLLILLLATAGAKAEDRPFNGTRGGGGRQNGCPQVWNTISRDLTSSFVSGGQCTDLARAAIRYSFHDAGTFSTKLPTVAPASGGADGSLLLSGDEISRPENGGLQDYHGFIKGKFAQYKSQDIGAADLIQFAANHAIVSCPGGPVIQTLIGRTDTTTSAPMGLLPIAFGKGADHDTILQLFMDKGFSAVDLAALIGAHSTSKAFTQSQVPVGASQDSTPGLWDVKYYSETYRPPPGVSRFEADINLSSPNTTVGRQFQQFVNNQGRWDGNFASAMFRVGLLGIPSSTFGGFVDCTGALPRGFRRREMIGAPINFRFR